MTGRWFGAGGVQVGAMRAKSVLGAPPRELLFDGGDDDIRQQTRCGLQHRRGEPAERTEPCAAGFAGHRPQFGMSRPRASEQPLEPALRIPA